MSSIKSSFNYENFEYEPTLDSKFIDILYQSILNGNVKKVKEFFSSALADNENENLQIENNDYNDYSPVRIDSPFTADDYNDNDYEYEESQDLSRQNKLMDITFSNGLSPLILASQKGFHELVQYFLSLNFDVNKVMYKDGLTALLGACSSASEDFESITKCIKLLMDAGANSTDTLDKNKQSALHLVASRNNVIACEYLVNYVDINCKDLKNCTPIMIAASKGFAQIVDILKTAGADLSIRNVHGLSAVELAMVNNYQDIVQLLIQPADKLDFYEAWSSVLKDLTESEKRPNINESFAKKFYSSKYFSDPIACMCASLNLTHLQPIFEKHGVTFTDLRSMSDSELKNIGIQKFSDRKCLLDLMQEVHKVNWTHSTSLYTPNFKLSITPLDMLDVVRNAYEHLEFIESSIKYVGCHLQTNPTYYSNYSQNKTFFDKCVTNCQLLSYKAKNVHENIVRIDNLFDKMYQYALDEDKSCQVNDEVERVKQLKLTKRYSYVVKTGLVFSGISIIGIILLRSRFVNI